MTEARQSRCPKCNREGDWLSGHFAPFCSNECRLTNLGRWLSEGHPMTATPEDLEGRVPPKPSNEDYLDAR